MNANLEAALGYRPSGRSSMWSEMRAAARRGWRVFPVNGKVPLISDWPNAASCDLQVLAEWERQYPHLDAYGIACGARSGLFALDEDLRHGGDDSLAALEREHGAMPATPVVLTGGGGRHFYSQHPGGIVGNRAGIAPGLDIRGDGGFVVGAGSLHASSRRYEWDVERHPDDVPLAPVPAWLLALCTRTDTKSAAPPEAWRELIGGVEAGRRNAVIARLTGHLLRRHVDPVLTLELVRCWNAARCQPSLDDSEVLRTVDSIAARELRRRGGTL